MHFVRGYIIRVATLFVALALVVGCGGDDDKGGTKNPNMQLNIEIEDITAKTAKIVVTHEFDVENTWYGFVTTNTSAPAHSLIDIMVSEGISSRELNRSKRYVSTLRNLTPDTEYRYIAFGLTSAGEVYGKISISIFTTLASSDGEPDETNGMHCNDAWSVMYVGEDEVDGELYEHVVKVHSMDDNSYAITIVETEYYAPNQLRELADALLADMKEYLADYNAEYGTDYQFRDMLYSGTISDHFDLMPGSHRAIVIGYTHDGEVSGLYAISPEFEVTESEPSPAYSAWLGEWSMEGENGAVTPVTLTQSVANKRMSMTGWEGFDDLAIEVEYDATLDAILLYSQLVAEDYPLGDSGVLADVYLFAADKDGNYYDNSQGDYYIAIGNIQENGLRTITRYGIDTPNYPNFVQMFFLAVTPGGQVYSFTNEDNIPTFSAILR